MSDLISRSALIEAITQHSKDVKSDVSMIQDIYQMAHQHIIQLIEIQPTAYDVEKVVEEIKEATFGVDVTYTDSEDVVESEEAIRIIRKGGVE